MPVLGSDPNVAVQNRRWPPIQRGFHHGPTALQSSLTRRPAGALRDTRGSTALDELARPIAQTALDAMPPDLMATLETEQGMAACGKAWPDIVNAFLFRAASEKAVLAGTRQAITNGGRRRRPDPAKQ